MKWRDFKMAENNMQVLIEGFDPSKVEAVNNFDKDWKEVYGAHQNNSIIQAPISELKSCLISRVQSWV